MRHNICHKKLINKEQSIPSLCIIKFDIYILKLYEPSIAINCSLTRPDSHKSEHL